MDVLVWLLGTATMIGCLGFWANLGKKQSKKSISVTFLNFFILFTVTLFLQGCSEADNSVTKTLSPTAMSVSEERETEEPMDIPGLTLEPKDEVVSVPTNTSEPTVTQQPTIIPRPTNTPNPELIVEPEKSTFSVTYLDVGQGDATLVECDGHYMLIDGGTSAYSSKLYSCLKNKGIAELDIVVASHAHSDHVGGLSGALNYAKANLVLCPVTEYDTKEFKAFKKYAEKNGSGIIVPNVGDTYQLGSAGIVVNAVNTGVDNDSSIVLTIDFQGNQFVFTGDAKYDTEIAALKTIKGPVAVLKVSHHGSDTSTTYQFLREVTPIYAVISCGSGNEYGHPTETVLSRLNDAEAVVFRTDLQGDIIFGYDGEEWYVGTEKEVDYADILTPGYYTLVPDDTNNADDSIDRSNMSSFGSDYIGNANSKVFHYPTCKSVKRMKESNKVYYENVTRDDMISKGYKSCGNCNP